MTDPIDFRTHSLTTRRDIDVELDEVFRERDEAIWQLNNANRINNELTESITAVSRENARLKARPTQPELAEQADALGDAIASINDVVARQITLLQGTGSLARAADIRRRQIAKGYTAEHDQTHGSYRIIQAAVALASGYSTRWPWGEEQYNRLAADPDRLLHAAAILCAAQDVIDAKDVSL